MNQRRQHSPAVYRRRRLVAALLAVAMLALVLWGARELMDSFGSDDQPELTADTEDQTPEADDDDSDSAATNGQAGTATPSPTADEATEDADETEETPEPELPEGFCAPAEIEVRAATNDESYGLNVAPLLMMEIENTGNQECTLDVGTAQQAFIVAHDGREIFNTAQCGASGDSLEIDFEPGQTETAHLTWPRSDSGVDCTEPAELPTGDYELAVSVSGITSDPHTFHITGTEQ